jgi:enoyl-CoA hydratase/carnithine racemase
MPSARAEFDGPFARVTLNHPVGNRINFEMRVDLFDAFARVAASNARVLIVRGEGADFCLGGDVRDWPGIPAATLRPKVEVYAKALDCLERLPIPTIAAVQGGCMGGGFELALSCDLIVAARSASFVFPEARLGILTLQGGVMQLAERIGRAKAIEVALLSEPVAAEQMAAWNVVNRVVDDHDLGPQVEVLARHFAAGAPRVHAATKALLRIWSLEGRKSAMEAWYDLSMPLFDTEDAQAALHGAADAVAAGKPFPRAAFAGR